MKRAQTVEVISKGSKLAGVKLNGDEVTGVLTLAPSVAKAWAAKGVDVRKVMQYVTYCINADLERRQLGRSEASTVAGEITTLAEALNQD